MTEWIRLILDVLLIVLVGAGLIQVTRLIRHLMGLTESRVEMEKFVREFNAIVLRAETGIKGLKNAARDSGDDLEKLVDRSQLVRDELTYLVESADQIAERLTKIASMAMRTEHAPETKAAAEAPKNPNTPPEQRAPATSSSPGPSSRAEKELLQALQKLS